VVRLIDEVIVNLPLVDARHEVVTVKLNSGKLDSGKLNSGAAESATFREVGLEISRAVF
jgi:hypothetical protein